MSYCIAKKAAGLTAVLYTWPFAKEITFLILHFSFCTSWRWTGKKTLLLSKPEFEGELSYRERSVLEEKQYAPGGAHILK